jgi:hypothetical protein
MEAHMTIDSPRTRKPAPPTDDDPTGLQDDDDEDVENDDVENRRDVDERG